MKNIFKNTIVILMISLPWVMQAQNSFKAEMANVNNGSKKVYQIISYGEKYRYDFEEEGMKGIVIVDPTQSKTAILIPGKKYVHYTETSSVTSRSNDPVQSLMTIKDRYTEKKLGSEEIAGFNCDKSELYADDQKIFTLWFSEQLNFPLRIENNLANDTYMELSRIKIQEIDVSVFAVPGDFTEVDDRMRPIIPEPPPPESWKTIEATLPINGEFVRGDRITFMVPAGERYRIILENNTDKPAKIVRTSMKDGKELSENKQGPASFRTTRLYKEETSSVLYIGDAGNDVIINVHEGKMHIEVFEEKR